MKLTARQRTVWAAMGALALALAATAYGLYRTGFLGGDAVPELPPGQTLDVAQMEALPQLPGFALEGAQGRITPGDLQGRWSFVFFGYTNCPNACPATLGTLNHVQETLRAQGVDPPRIVFISLDPQRDTPAVLRRYAAAFGPDTVGVTGDTAALRDLVRFFGVSFERRAGADANSYTLDHTTNFFLVRPDGRWMATFAPGDDGDAVLADTQTLMRLPIKK